MGLDEVKSALLNDAHLKEKEVLDAAKAKKAELLQQAKNEVKAYRKEKEAELTLEKERMLNREVAAAKLEAKKKLFLFKKEILDNLYAQAYKKITKLPQAERKKALTSLLKASQKELDVATVYCSNEDKKLISTKATLHPFGLDGGIVCENKDKTVKIDYSFATLFEDVKENTLQNVGRLLF